MVKQAMTKSFNKEESQLPDSLRKIACQSKNGILAWKKEDISQVLKKLAELQIAVLGGEIWAIDNGKIHGVLPLKSEGTSVFHWSIEREKDEAWGKFVKRSLDETVSAINNLNPEQDVKKEFANKLYYNLTLSNELNYNKL